jgi:phosphate-selective porin OprO and OprP
MRAWTMVAAALVALADGSVRAQDPVRPSPAPLDADELRREINELRAKERELERRLDARENPPGLPDLAAPRFRFGRGGFVFGTADGKTEIKLRAVVNLDGRFYLGPGAAPDTFLIRRARPFIDGTLFGIVDFRILPDFAQGTPQLLDAYVDIHPAPWLHLRGGRFMVPLGLEWWQKDTTITFTERSLATDLVPYRDIGLLLWGEIGEGTLWYGLMIGNGAPDSGNGPDLDGQSSKDYVGRVFLRPLKLVSRAAFTDLGFGVAGSYGQVTGTATASGLGSYKSVGQESIFTYVSGGGTTAMPIAPALSAGDRWRVSPQLYWYVGPFGLIGEYVMSVQHVSRAGQSTAADVHNRAWNLTASFVLTLERAAYEGVTPHHPVDFRHRWFGALELTLRYSELRIGGEAFPNFADPTASVRAARELAGGLNWYVTDYVKLMLSYHHTSFAGGSPMGDRLPEHAILARLQLAL